MNIFILDTDIQKSVEYHCDKHVVKMVLEAAQVLCTVQRMWGNMDGRLYKATHANHPVVKWAYSRPENYRYVYQYFMYLAYEYSSRFHKDHKSYVQLKYALANTPHSTWAYTLPEEFEYPCVMDDIYKIHLTPQSLQDIVDNYRNYYIKGKKDICTWKTEKPYWFRGV